MVTIAQTVVKLAAVADAKPEVAMVESLILSNPSDKHFKYSATSIVCSRLSRMKLNNVNG